MMINKRLINEVPQAKQYIKKQVFTQWQGLLANVLLIFLFAYLIEGTWNKSLASEGILCISLIITCLILFRMYAIKRAAKLSYLASEDVKDTLRDRLFRKLLELQNKYSTHVSTSEVVQLSVEGIDQLETYFGRYLPQLFYSMLAPGTLFLILVWIDWKSSLVLLLCVPFIPISIIAVQKFAKKRLSKYWGAYASLGDSFLENLQALTTLKIYQSDAYKHQKMNEEAENFRKITMKVLTMQLNSISVMDIVAYGGAAIGSIFAISAFLQGDISLGGVIAIVLLSSEFFIPLRLLGSFFHIAMNGMAASDKIFKILDIPCVEKGSVILNDSTVSVTLNNIHFSYDDARQVLQDIHMHMEPTSFTAIVGESGCGKSTCAKLIMGMMNNYQGEVLINDKERRTIAGESFWKHAAYITHNAVIFKGTVRDNLRMGKASATDKEMLEALRSAKLLDFMMSEDGLDTILQEGGNNLSGGQRQRLSLARSLLKDCELYVFDEATSNIDVESEAVILSLIKKLAISKTVVMITHRLSTVKDCSKIYVMEQGKIHEEGNHIELMENRSLYYEMAKKQEALEEYYGGTQDES